MAQKVLVISGVSMKEGGIRTVLTEALTALNTYAFDHNLKVYALVPDAQDYAFSHIECIGFPKAKKSWWNRIWIEYVVFKRLSQKIKPDFWLSLHDTTPNVACPNRFMYAHHPTVVYQPKFSDWYFNYKIGVFALLYHWVYRWNIHKNKAVFVQQQSLYNYFKKRGVRQIIRCPWQETRIPSFSSLPQKPDRKLLFYPLIPRSFKNVEILGEALQLLSPEENAQLEIWLTFSKNENRYARYLAQKYPLNNLCFIGKLSREEVFAHYEIMDALIFPSRLETWGLPISEAKAMQKPLWVADVPYAHETVGTYENVVFFNPNNPQQLADTLRQWLQGKAVYTGNQAVQGEGLVLENWTEMFDFICSAHAKV